MCFSGQGPSCSGCVPLASGKMASWRLREQGRREVQRKFVGEMTSEPDLSSGGEGESSRPLPHLPLTSPPPPAALRPAPQRGTSPAEVIRDFPVANPVGASQPPLHYPEGHISLRAHFSLHSWFSFCFPGWSFSVSLVTASFSATYLLPTHAPAHPHLHQGIMHPSSFSLSVSVSLISVRY